ncbi:MAG: MaoC family dehydratase N-terminal domain-containing protein [Dehalococcoidia bacterium]|nr:MaoC family dehydratase N-terminal domain-containing protein [Dehalococcoidia bacterium]
MAVEDAPGLIPPEAMAMVGEPLGDPVSGEITRKEAQRYAKAVDDLNPIYFDEAAAQAAGYRTLVAPPTFLAHVVVQHGNVADLRIDGIYRSGNRRGVNLRAKRVMFGGEEWDFLLPVYVGDTVTAQTRLHSLEEKDGASGPFALMTTETTYTNQAGQVVARARGRSIAR